MEANSGRTFWLTAIGIIFDAKPATARTRDFSKLKTASELHSQLTAFCPWLAEYYADRTDGNELTPSIVYNRMHKMFYDNKKEGIERGGISAEHYKRHAALKGLIDPVNNLYLRFRRRALGCTLDEALRVVVDVDVGAAAKFL